MVNPSHHQLKSLRSLSFDNIKIIILSFNFLAGKVQYRLETSASKYNFLAGRDWIVINLFDKTSNLLLSSTNNN